MRSLIALFAPFVLLLTAASPAVPPTAPPVMVPPTAPAVVETAAPCKCGPLCDCNPCKCGTDPAATTCAVGIAPEGGSGSGTCISSGGGKSLVLTCNHVFATQPYPGADHPLAPYPIAAWVKPRGSTKVLPATAIGGDQQADLAFVIVDGEMPVAELAEADPAPGTEVRHWGVGTGGGVGKVTTTPIRGYRPNFEFAATATSASGDSGAGYFTPDGKLVAVHCGKFGFAPTDPTRGTPVSAVTVVIEARGPRGPFARTRDRLAAWREARKPVLVAPEAPKSVAVPKPPASNIAAPKAVPTAPPTYVLPGSFGTPDCPNGNCPNTRYYYSLPARRR